QVFIRKIVGDMARRMARGVNDNHVKRTKFKFLIVSNMAIGAKGWDHKWEAEQARLEVRILRLGFVQWMNQDFRGWKMLFDECVIGEMIEVAVRQPKADKIPPAFCRFRE